MHRARKAFAQAFGAAAPACARAPGRVNLMGDHTDYNEGFALPCGIDRHTVAAFRTRDDDLVCVVTADAPGFQDRFRWHTDSPSQHRPIWTRYVRGVFAGLRAQGHVLGGIELAIAGDVPQGAGLSSSASLELAVAEALRIGFRLPVGHQELAKAGQYAEHHLVGCRCGLMDQLAVSSARPDHAMLLDCRSLQTEYVRIPTNLAIVVIDSGVRRGLVDSAYNLRRHQCSEAARFFGVPSLRDIDTTRWAAETARMDPVLARRARHVISENARVLELSRCFVSGNTSALHEIFAASHASLRDDFEVSTPAVDYLVELVRSTLGQLGAARMTGGGFGGCVVALSPHDAVSFLAKAIDEQYRSPSGQRATLHVCQAVGGCGAS
jgi:galactokinase